MAFSLEERSLIRKAISEGKNKTQILRVITDSRKVSGVAPEPQGFQRLRDVPSDIIETGRGIAGAVEERIEKGKEILERPQTTPSRIFQTTTNILGGVGDVAGEVIKGGVKLFTTPEQEEKAAAFISRIGQKISKVPEVRQWIENLNELKKTNPELAGNAVSLMEGGQFLLEFAGLKAGAGAIRATTEGVETGVRAGLKTGREAVEEGVKRAGDIIEGTKTKVQGFTFGTAKPKDPLERALSAVTPDTKDLTPTEFQAALRKGQISPQTKIQPSKFILSEDQKKLATRYKDLLQDDPVKNSGNVINKIADIDSQVEKHLDKFNTTIWSKNKFAKHLKDSVKDLDDITLDLARIEKAKNQLVKSFVDNLPKNATLKDLWKARKELDQLLNRQGTFTGSPTLAKDAKRAVRNAVQDFISDITGDSQYKNFMKEMTDLFRLNDNIAIKATKERGLSAIQLWMKQNPEKVRLLRWLLPTSIGVAGGAIIL